MVTKKMVTEMNKELEEIKEEVRMEEGRAEEMLKKARAENNEESWSRYGEWQGMLQAKREEAKRLEKKRENLQKMIEEDERR